MSLQQYLYQYLSNCDSVRALVDDENGIRRMDRPSKGTYRTCICIGNIVYGAVPGLDRRPILGHSPALSIWVRPEFDEMGDMTLQAIFLELMKRLVWVGDGPFPAQNCVGVEPSVLVYASEFAGHDIPPYFDEISESWTTRFRIRFQVGIPTCLPIADACEPCPEFAVEGNGGAGPELPAPALLAGTAFSQVSPQQEHLIPQRDLYVTHPLINTTTFEAFKKPLSIAIAYTTPSLIFQQSSTWFAGIRAITVESDFWHIGGSLEANRVEHSANLWHVRPSVSLADRMADYVIANLNPYFNGIFEDEAPEDVSNAYLTAYRTADEWVEANLASVQADWRAMHKQYQSRMKAHFGAARALVVNSAGKPYANADGMWMEDQHAAANGNDWAFARFNEQKAFWEGNENRFVHPNPQIAGVLNVVGGPTLDFIFSIPGLVWPGTEE